MADELTIPFQIAALEEAQPPLRMFYAKADDGTFTLRTTGEPPGFAPTSKLDEFRDSNRALNAKVTQLATDVAALTTAKTDLEARLAAFDGIDPEAARTALAMPPIDPRVAELETQTGALAAQLAREQFKNTVGGALLRAGGRPEAMEFLLTKAAGVFAMQDGKVTTPAFSAIEPGTPLSVKEWIAGQLTESAFAFLPARGGGTPPTPHRVSGPVTPPRKTVDANDPVAFGKHLADIAAGTVDVI